MVWRKIHNFAPPKQQKKINNKNNMNREDILNAVKCLAAGQGFYGRLYEVLTSGRKEAENLLDKMVEQNFKDPVDMILWFES